MAKTQTKTTTAENSAVVEKPAKEVNTSAITPEALEALENDNARLKMENEALKESIIEMNELLLLKEAQGISPKPVISHNKAMYQFLVPKFSLKGKIYEAKAIASNPDAYASVVEEITSKLPDGKLKYRIVKSN